MSRSKPAPYPDAHESEQDFVSRWSRLKQEDRHRVDPAAGAGTNSDAVSVDGDEAGGTQQTPGRRLTDEDMPDIDSLDYDSDYRDFLSPGVSEQLRKLALRKLFHNDVFNIRDGLDEYDDDFTHFEKLGGIVTSDMRHQMEMEARRKAEQLLEKDEQSSDDPGIEQHEEAGTGQASMDQVATGGGETGPESQEHASIPVETDAPAAEATVPAGRSPVTKRSEDNG